jgi:glycosyltransferase involved in cell wall biosynthesis
MKAINNMIEVPDSSRILHIAPELNFVKNFILPLITDRENNGQRSDVLCAVSDYVLDDREIQLSEAMLGLGTLYIRNVKLRSRPHLLIGALIFLIKLIKKSNYNIVVCHTSIDSFIPIILIRLFSKSRIVYFNHGIPALGYSGLTKYLLQMIEKSNLTFSHITLAVGLSMQRELNDLSRVASVALVKPGSACGIVPLATSIADLGSMRKNARARLKINPDERIVLFVGRPVARKGFFDVLRAWQIIQRKNYRLFLVGPSECELTSSGLDLENVETFGYVDDPSNFYLAADVLCVPSHHEGFGYCYLEAASAGCVPICSSIPGPTDFITDRHTGLCVPAGDVEVIAATLRHILENDKLRERLQVAAFGMSKAFDRMPLVIKINQFLATQISLSGSCRKN